MLLVLLYVVPNSHGLYSQPGPFIWTSSRSKRAWHLPLCLLPAVPMHVWDASLENHDARWKLQWVWGQQPSWVPEKPYSARRRKTRQNSGPPGPEQWIQLLQEEGASEGPDGSSHLPEHPRHWQILPVDIPSFLHIFQLDLLVSVCLGTPRLCLVKVTSRPLDCPAWYGHVWGLASCPHMDLLTMSPHRQSSSSWTTLSSILAPGGPQEPSSCPSPDLVGLLIIPSVLCSTSCLSGTVFFCSCVWMKAQMPSR